MTQSGDPFAGLGAGGGSARVRQPPRGWRSYGGRDAFWLVAGFGAVLLCVAWVWYGMAFHEEMTEQGKALSAGTTMAGFGFAFGGIPLIIAHLLVLVPLLAIGLKYHSRRAVGIVQPLAAVGIASVLGITVAQLLWAGMLFTMYADAPGRWIP